MGYTIESREELINEIAESLEGYSEGMKWSIDLTAQEVVPICDRSVVGEDCMPEDGHLMMDIDQISSRESFQIMEDFITECTSTEEARFLHFALKQRHPFSTFKNALYELNIQGNWFGYSMKALKEKARRWMIDNHIDFKDGKIIYKSDKVYTYRKEGEE
nr:UPF0158 family protein [Parabacteroides goldsteinii]